MITLVPKLDKYGFWKLTQPRFTVSFLNDDLYKANILSSFVYSCNDPQEDENHYFFVCKCIKVFWSKNQSDSQHKYKQFNLMWILQSDWLIFREQYWLYLITWIGIVTSPTYSFTNDKFKKSHDIIVIKIEVIIQFCCKN